MIRNTLNKNPNSHTRVLLSKNEIDNVAKFRHESETKVRDIGILNDANNETFNNLISTETWTDITDGMDYGCPKIII